MRSTISTAGRGPQPGVRMIGIGTIARTLSLSRWNRPIVRSSRWRSRRATYSSGASEGTLVTIPVPRPWSMNELGRIGTARLIAGATASLPPRAAPRTRRVRGDRGGDEDPAVREGELEEGVLHRRLPLPLEPVVVPDGGRVLRAPDHRMPVLLQVPSLPEAPELPAHEHIARGRQLPPH